MAHGHLTELLYMAVACVKHVVLLVVVIFALLVESHEHIVSLLDCGHGEL